MITSLLHTITDFSSSRRGKFVVIVLWLLATGALTAIAPELASLYDNSIQQRIPSNADSQVAQNLLLREFPSNRGTPALLVFYDPAGLNVDDRIRIRQINDWLAAQQKAVPVAIVVSAFTVPQATTQLVSLDGTTMTMIATLNSSASDPATLRSVTTIRHYLQGVTAGSSLQAHLTGPAGILSDATAVFGSVDVRLLLVTIGLVFVLLIVLYRSPILALLPLFGVGVAMQVVNALLGFGARAGLFPVSSMSSQIATVLLFGAGTDYSIFIASRFREELARTQDKHQAMRKTMRAVGEAITSSAMTVILSLLTLLFAALGLYSSLGPVLAIAIVVMLLAGLTLVPALITWLGRAAYWPFVPRYQPQQETETASVRGFWGRLGQWTVRHRIAAVAFSALLLAVLALGNIGSEPSFNFLTAFRVPTDSSRGYALLQQHFPAGTLAPTTVLIHFHGAASDAYQHLVQLDAITATLQKAPGVATVRGPTRPNGSAPAVDPATLQANIAALPASLRSAIRNGQGLSVCSSSPCTPHTPGSFTTIGAYAASTSFVAPDETTVQISIIFKDDPYSLPAIQRIPLLRDTINRALAANGLGAGAATSASFHIAGQTAQLSDQLAYNQRDTLLIVPAVLVLVGLVLALLLRSLVAPVYLLGAVTLNFLAAIGICSFFFQRVQGQDGFNYAIPLYTFVFLVALGADYTIFLMSRVREEVELHGLEVGVASAVSRTGSVITSAGLILAGTFLVLTTLPLTILYQLGVCVAVGVLLDTFIVRGLLIPGMVVLLGRWNWWPRRRPTQRALALLMLLVLCGTFVSCAGGGRVQLKPGTSPGSTCRGEACPRLTTCRGEACPRLTPASIPVIPITAVDYGYEMPATINLRAGLVDIALVNNGTQAHQAQLARLNRSVTPNQVFTEFVTKRDQSAGFALLTLAGGSDIVAPGYGQETILNLPAGDYVLLCLVVGDDGVSHVDKGMIHFFTVKAATTQVTPPASDGEVVMRDNGYILPPVIGRAQALTLRVTNQGSEPHEMNIVRLAPGKSIRDVLAFFRSPSGPPPLEEFGGMAALAPGESGWVRLHLEPGNYALCSLIPDLKTGQPQLTQGMIAPFTVNER